MCRSGHASSVYNGKMFIFGGILEITKELNDLIVYDYTKQIFSTFETEEVAVDDTVAKQIMAAAEVSPAHGHQRPINKGSAPNSSMNLNVVNQTSPQKSGFAKQGASPSATMKKGASIK